MAVPQAALMLNTTARIKRTMATAGVLAAVAAPTASALTDAPSQTTSPAPHAERHNLATIAAHHEEIAAAAWERSHPHGVVRVAPAAVDGDGLDAPSAAIGAGIVFVLVLVEAGGRSVLRRRRSQPRLS